MIHFGKNFVVGSKLSFVINQQSKPARGQVQLCHNPIVNLFQKENNPCKQGFPELNNKRQMFDYYLPGNSNITSHYGIITIEILPPQSSNQPPEYKQML